jgi:hypothetical protein
MIEVSTAFQIHGGKYMTRGAARWVAGELSAF